MHHPRWSVLTCDADVAAPRPAQPPMQLCPTRTGACVSPPTHPPVRYLRTRAAVNKQTVEVAKDDFITSKSGPDAGR